jgi:hypothetical protein
MYVLYLKVGIAMYNDLSLSTLAGFKPTNPCSGGGRDVKKLSAKKNTYTNKTRTFSSAKRAQTS